MNFTEEYKKIKNLVQDELSIIESKLTDKIEIREPLAETLINFLKSPSKRVRSLTAILLEKTFGEELSEKQLEFLSVIELIHNASLIHDDIIDECKTRRGKKTIDAEFNNKLAVISGDYILSVAMEKLCKIGDIKLIEKVIRTIRQMCIGEINQNFDRYKIGSIENYIEKTKNKTAYLFETALVGVSALSNSDRNLEDISSLGINIGIAFQIRDDIMNFISQDKDKPAKNDVAEGIYNAPVILGDEADNYMSGIEKTKILLNNYTSCGAAIINKFPENKYSEALLKFLELLENV